MRRPLIGAWIALLGSSSCYDLPDYTAAGPAGGSANLVIETVQITKESRKTDRAWQPGEQITFGVHVKNEGTEIAKDVWISIASGSAKASFVACASQGPEGSGICRTSPSCDCQSAASYSRQTIAPDRSSDGPVVLVDAILMEGSPVEPVSFTATFHDSASKTWTDTFAIEVTP